MEYTLIRSGRKTLSLELRADGSLLVRAPRLLSKRKIEAFIEEKSSWIEKKQADLQARRENHPLKTDAEVQEQIKAAYHLLLPKVKQYSEIIGLFPISVKITKAEKRFGSCSSRGSICFSYHLIEYPDEAIDYVVIHELAHLKELNHSPTFWFLVKQHCPNYKICQKQLKQ